ncbi:hypothetical protein [Streptomyces sp. S1D4-23]|uniref:hypothetical protein n=1 Tax=Streptomyces sp. S1D4-23 TaxID=2594463 RepID=UPI001164D448|nr:hypothetical protein [Streptomyces sp. S1D4-23]QDO09128.1 hypothetical protein FNV68_25350 [Streptomyces sp. S1D4-23]
MSVNNNRPPPDNRGGPATVVEIVFELMLIAMFLALIDTWVSLNLQAYFVSILGSLGGYLLTQSNGPEPPTGRLA